MLDNEWDRFVIYVNAYYAVQEAYDSARRAWERPARGLKEFCRDANPFVWDQEGSVEPEIYQSFAQGFNERFGKNTCEAAEGLAFAHDWLAGLEGGIYGDELTASLHATANEDAWEEACRPIARQIAARAANIERTPQEDPMLMEMLASAPEPVPATAPEPAAAPASEPVAPESPAPGIPSQENIDAVIALLANGDEAFAEQLRARLASSNDTTDGKA